MAGLGDQVKQSTKLKSLSFKICLCKYCGKKFLNSQALGGHQNAHRRERQEAKIQKQEMRNMMMMANFGKPLMPGSFIEPHGLAQHQIIEGQPFYSLSYSSTSSHPVINYWPGSYHLDDGVLSSHGPNHLVQGEVDNSHVENDNHNLSKLELPDLNLDPSL